MTEERIPSRKPKPKKHHRKARAPSKNGLVKFEEGRSLVLEKTPPVPSAPLGRHREYAKLVALQQDVEAHLLPNDSYGRWRDDALQAGKGVQPVGVSVVAAVVIPLNGASRHLTSPDVAISIRGHRPPGPIEGPPADVPIGLGRGCGSWGRKERGPAVADTIVQTEYPAPQTKRRATERAPIADGRSFEKNR